MTVASVPLGGVASFVRGITYKPADVVPNFSNGSVVCMRTANVQVVLDDADVLSIPRSFVRDEAKILREGDLLVSTANSWTLVGKCCWVPKLNYEATVGGFIAALRGDPEQVDPRYLYRWFSSPKTQAKARNCGRQTTNISNMDLGRCLALKLPLPPLPEQRRIAATLDKADALRAKRREAIAKLDQLLQSVFLDMFGDPAINSKDWPTRSLKELGKVQTGSTPPSAIDGMFDGSVPFVTPGDLGGLLVTSKRTLTSAGVAKSRLATPGSTLVCCVGATIGKMGMATQDSAFNQQINAVSWGDKVLPLYGFHLMRFFGEEIATRGASTTLPILKKSAFEKIEVPVASIELQQHFALVAESIVRQQNIFLQSAKKQDALFASLQHRAFSGTL